MRFSILKQLPFLGGWKLEYINSLESRFSIKNSEWSREVDSSTARMSSKCLATALGHWQWKTFQPEGKRSNLGCFACPAQGTDDQWTVNAVKTDGRRRWAEPHMSAFRELQVILDGLDWKALKRASRYSLWQRNAEGETDSKIFIGSSLTCILQSYSAIGRLFAFSLTSRSL